MHILLVEDDPLVASGLCAGLALHDFTVDHFSNAKAARSAMFALHSDAVILDLGLPDEDGMSLLREWRARGIHTPVLILTARDAIPDRVAGLHAGADDYLPKPFDLDELVARLKALMRRAAGQAQSVIEHGPLRFDTVTRETYWFDKPVNLPRRELALLEKLLFSRGAILSAGQIKDSLYGFQTDIESNALNVHIHNLRRRLCPEIIQTVRGVGYRLGKLNHAEHGQ
ncbi:MAG: response regulator [Alcanivorax sp.]|nr:response regulator [Alcanivorax sp.]